jgi:7-carboxy-7-deazaguanine synthase
MIDLLPSVPAEHGHRVALLRDLPAGELLIHEIYESLQGESTFAGLRCVFIRTAVCDLRCHWCDTPHAFNRGERMTRKDVLTRAMSYDCPLVEITGGEPLLQPDVFPLLSELCDAGKTVLLETSGGRDIGPVDRRVHIIMDLKCPDSGECERNYWPNLDRLKPSDEIKFVIASERDFHWAEEIVRKHQLDRRFMVLFSTSFRDVTPRQLADWLIASRLNARMQLQMHKFIWDPKATGV